MKSTGIIRRIDDLGRVVIPKEIRKSMNLREGAEVEIFTSDEKLIMQKYSHIQVLSDIAEDAAVILRSVIGFDTFVVDNEKVIVAESVYRDMAGEKLSLKLISELEKRKSMVVKNPNFGITAFDDRTYNYLAISPIVTNGDLVGAVVCFSKNSIEESDLKSIDIVTKYIAKKLEF